MQIVHRLVVRAILGVLIAHHVARREAPSAHGADEQVGEILAGAGPPAERLLELGQRRREARRVRDRLADPLQRRHDGVEQRLLGLVRRNDEPWHGQRGEIRRLCTAVQHVVPQPRLGPQALGHPLPLARRRDDGVVERIVQRGIDHRVPAHGQLIVRGNEAAIVHAVAEAIVVAVRLAGRVDRDLGRDHVLMGVVLRGQTHLDMMLPHRD